MTFNTKTWNKGDSEYDYSVLNLVINGWPSIRIDLQPTVPVYCFKPCYKWMTFNTLAGYEVKQCNSCFKPCYKWMTFNTNMEELSNNLESRF